MGLGRGLSLEEMRVALRFLVVLLPPFAWGGAEMRLGTSLDGKPRGAGKQAGSWRSLSRKSAGRSGVLRRRLERAGLLRRVTVTRAVPRPQSLRYLVGEDGGRGRDGGCVRLHRLPKAPCSHARLQLT